MKTQILKQTKNPFLNREEILIGIESDSTPSFEDVKKNLEKPEFAVVKKISGNFGSKKFNADVFVYETKDAMESVEPKSKKKQPEQKQAPATAPAPAAEEKKEPTKEETPKQEPAKEDSEVKPEKNKGVENG